MSSGSFDMSFLNEHRVEIGVAVVAALLIPFALKWFSPKKTAPKRKNVLDPENFIKFPLIEKRTMTTGVPCPVNLYRFALPNKDDVLGLPVGQHISIRAKVFDEKENTEKEIFRSYTPTSSDDDLGYFDLVIKVYPQGKMSRFVDNLKIGDCIEVRGPKGKFVYEQNKYSHLAMIAGGTGLTPMLQVIKEVLKRPEDNTKISFLYANVNSADIILKEELDALAVKHSDRFHIYNVLNNPPEGWTEGVGFVSEQMIREHFPAPTANVRVLLCGPPPMITAMKGHLDKVGFAAENLFQF